MYFYIALWILVISLSAAFFIIGVIEWSRNQLNIDFLDFYKRGLEEAATLAREKFLDQVRLTAWEIKRNTSSAKECERAERIFLAGNNEFDGCRIEDGELRVELITAEDEEEIETEEITITIPRHMKVRLLKLFTASRIISIFEMGK